MPVIWAFSSPFQVKDKRIILLNTLLMGWLLSGQPFFTCLYVLTSLIKPFYDAFFSPADSILFRYQKSKTFGISIILGRDYGLPVLMNQKKIKKWFRCDVKRFISEDEILVDQLFIATPRRARKGLAHYYRNVLLTLNSGLNCLLVRS